MWHVHTHIHTVFCLFFMVFSTMWEILCTEHWLIKGNNFFYFYFFVILIHFPCWWELVDLSKAKFLFRVTAFPEGSDGHFSLIHSIFLLDFYDLVIWFLWSFLIPTTLPRWQVTLYHGASTRSSAYRISYRQLVLSSSLYLKNYYRLAEIENWGFGISACMLN